MPETTRQQKITFGEMRESGVRGVLVYCSDYRDAARDLHRVIENIHAAQHLVAGIDAEFDFFG
jgi:hypothetical protein